VRINNRSNRPRKIAKYFLFAAIGVVFGAGFIMYPKVAGYIERIKLDQENEEVMATIIEEQVIEQTVENIQNVVAEAEKEIDQVVILENAYLKVPFVCQAPFQTEANWVYHEESCEEAAVLQAHYYIEGITETNKQTAHDTILNMIEWQKQNFGEHRDIYANDVQLFIRDYYGYEEDDIVITYDADIRDIKKAVSAGYPVIVPIMGDKLHNPYYPYPGYHMLTVIGYTPDKIITNDVGTRRGKDFSYPYERFMTAMEAAGGDIVVIEKLPTVDKQAEAVI
jgi:hypothetical protein